MDYKSQRPRDESRGVINHAPCIDYSWLFCMLFSNEARTFVCFSILLISSSAESIQLSEIGRKRPEK